MTPDELRRHFSAIDTERLSLRAPAPGDLGAVFAIHGDPETYRFHPASRMRSEADAVKWLEHGQREWDRHGVGLWAVRVRTRPEVVGFGGLSRVTFHGRPALNTYYRFALEARSHGYATEMTLAAHGLAARLLPELPRIVRTHPDNDNAQSVAVKCGLARRPELDERDAELAAYVSHWP
jgi:ribosomal-protein-alanine N-acetyltransferase